MKTTGAATIGRLSHFVRGHAVFCAALVVALCTLPFASAPSAVLESVDTRTIASLFCVLMSVEILIRAGMMDSVARLFGRAFPSARAAVCIVVGMTMLLSMFITNDMALVAMLPLAAAVLRHGGWMRTLPFCFVMQNLAANLGGMILPFGNPQNLYLYGYYSIGFGEFIEVMAVPFAASVVLIAVCAAVGFGAYGSGKPASKTAPQGPGKPSAAGEGQAQSAKVAASRRNSVVGVAMFAITVCAVLRVIPLRYVTVAVIAAALLFDRRALVRFDWFLLATFACFFIFAGNVSGIPAVRGVLGAAMDSAPLLTSALASQVISNVPAAIMLSHVSSSWEFLLAGVNIGGAGTLVASLATLITIDRYRTLRLISGADIAETLKTPGRFIAYITAWGMGFLAVLLAVCSLVPAALS